MIQAARDTGAVRTSTECNLLVPDSLGTKFVLAN